MSDKSSINIQAGGDIGSVSGIVGGNVSGVVNLGTINGSVSNAISQLPDSPQDADSPSLKEILKQLQVLIEEDPELPAEDKAEALEQVGALAEAGQNPNDNTFQKAGRTAMKILKGTTAGLSETNNLVKEWKSLLPIITTILPFLI